MNTFVKDAIVFAFGAAVGGVIGYIYASKHRDEYEIINDNNEEETDKKDETHVGLNIKAWEKPPITDYVKMYKGENENTMMNVNDITTRPVDDSDLIVSTKESEKDYKITLLTPDEFDEEANKGNAVELHYYEDGILADDDDNVINDIDEFIGLESLKHFGEFEDNLLFVKNNGTDIAYEVVYENTTYANATGESATYDWE